MSRSVLRAMLTMALVGAMAIALHESRGQGSAAGPHRADAPVYEPPLRGAPSGRVAGGTRGPRQPGDAEPGQDRESVALVALAPAHTGQTTAVQPVLYWFISRPTARPIEFTLIEATAGRPLVEQRLPAPDRPGVQRLALAEVGAQLELGKRYRWSVSLVVDSRSRDIVASATIERVPEPAALGPDDRARPAALARAGLWYDAFDALSGLIAGNPGDGRLHGHRAALLEQVGLAQPARWERAASR